MNGACMKLLMCKRAFYPGQIMFGNFDEIAVGDFALMISACERSGVVGILLSDGGMMIRFWSKNQSDWFDTID